MSLDANEFAGAIINYLAVLAGVVFVHQMYLARVGKSVEAEQSLVNFVWSRLNLLPSPSSPPLLSRQKCDAPGDHGMLRYVVVAWLLHAYRSATRTGSYPTMARIDCITATNSHRLGSCDFRNHVYHVSMIQSIWWKLL